MTYETKHALWLILKRVDDIIGIDLDAAEIYTAPLIWWVGTARCTGGQEIKLRNLRKRQITTLAKRLIKADGNYDKAISLSAEYLNSI